jgi:hypothetical protein
MWTKETWPERVEEFLKSKETMAEKYSWPFPMGVFGTLREHQGNNGRMRAGKISEHRVGFLRHFYASGLSVGFDRNSCAPFEVFYYDPAEWKKMIPGVDRLEGFSPESAREHDWGYYRTLVWVNLLPKGTVNKWFPEGRADLYERRDMAIDPKAWDDHEAVPCWVYSNMTTNRRLNETICEPKEAKSKFNSNPLIWPEPTVAKEREKVALGRFYDEG